MNFMRRICEERSACASSGPERGKALSKVSHSKGAAELELELCLVSHWLQLESDPPLAVSPTGPACGERRGIGMEVRDIVTL